MVLDAQWRQFEISREKVMRGTPKPRLGSIEHEKKAVGRIEPEKIAKQQSIVRKNYVDSFALPVGFA
jgi:hypothetical protein